MNAQKEREVLTEEKRGEAKRLLEIFGLIQSSSNREKVVIFAEGVATAETGRLPTANA